MMKQKIAILWLTLFLVQSGCLEETNPAFDEKAFTKIYDNHRFSASYFPIDIQQTSDGGYLILGGRRLTTTTFSGIYLLKTDKFGNFVNDVEVDESYVNPVGDLMKIGADYYFLCMDPLTLQTHIARVDSNGEGFTTTPASTSLTYPAAASLDNTNIITLSYNSITLQSVISVITSAGSVTSSKGYSIGAGEGVEEPIINHYLRTGRQFPFQTGKVGNLYFFNGFYNYTFSLVFTDLSQDVPNGVVQGQQDDGGLSAVVPVSGNTFAAGRFNFGDNFLLPRVTLNSAGISSSTDLGGFTLPELSPNATVRVIRAVFKNRNVVVFAANTKSKHVGLYFYDETTGEFISSRYVGYSNPFEIASIRQTAEGDLILCGTTYVAGRFGRFSIVKIPQNDIAI
ncbi:MAG: hypothetical protein ACK4RF_06335 [Cyclobacteriaceae bacterium]